MPERLKAVAYGGGVQSTALLVMAATRRIDFPVFLFADVGHDSEDPATLDYLHRWAKPYAARHGVQLHEVRRTRRDGSTETLYGRLTRQHSRSLPIPVRMSGGAPGTRSCTAEFKIRVVGQWLQARGATAAVPATVGVGISLDEVERASNRRVSPYERVVYPLLDHDPPLRRADCERLICAAGLPIPPKSACWFCPLHRPSAWAQMRRDREHLFARACELENLLNVRRTALGRDPVFLTRFGRPLSDAIAAAQHELPGLDDDGSCDSGRCFT